MIVSVILLILVLFSQSSSKSLCDNRQVTDVAKFIAALLVVNGHLFAYNVGGEWACELSLGSQCVGLFLFLSAYGLMSAWERKGITYLDGFLTRRLERVVIPLVTAYAISLPVYAFCIGPVDWMEVLTTLYWGGPYLQFSWYVTEIVVLYLLFFLSAKMFPKHLALCLSFMTVGFWGVLLAFKQPLWYILGLPCFIMGIVFQRYESKVMEFISGNRRWIILPFIGLFFIEFQWHYVAESVEFLSKYRYQYIANYMSDILFVVVIAYIMTNVSLRTDLLKASMWGAIVGSFYEIYLMQKCVMVALRIVIEPVWLYIPSVLVVTVIVATIMNQINKKVCNLF